MPKVSVIIPVYNVEKYLKECLDSVVNQTLKDIEIICVNDGSTDSSLNILQEYAKNDSRIVIIDKQNQGVSVARNTALQKANGKYVIFIDSDDVYPSNDILETLYTKANENNAKICGGEFAEFKNDISNLKQNFSETFYGYTFEKEGFIEYIDYQFDFGYHRFIYNTHFIREHNLNYPLYTRYEDPVFFVKAMILAEQFYAVKKICYAYRICHKPDTWNTTAICDLLKGILDVLTIAKNNSLDKLFKLTEIRLCKEYLCRIFTNLNNDTKPYLDKCVEIIPNTKKYMLKYKIKFFLQSIFSIKNEYIGVNKYKNFTFLGFKFTYKRIKTNA